MGKSQGQWIQPALHGRSIRALTDRFAAISRRVSGVPRASRRKSHAHAYEYKAGVGEEYEPETRGSGSAARDDEFWSPPSAATPQGTSPQGSRRRPRRYSRRVVLVFAALSLMISFCSTSGVLRAADAFAAARDAKSHVAAVEAILKTGNYFSTDALQSIQTHLDATSMDLARIQAYIPAETLLANAPGSSGLVHTVRMAAALVHAGQYSIDAALILLPHLKGILSDLNAAPGATASNSKNTPITDDEIAQAKQDVLAAIPLAESAVNERQKVNDEDLSRLGFGSLVPMLHKLDTIAPHLPTYLGYAKGFMDVLPATLGMAKSAQYLLFNMDSDELRPTGGFLGNYAVLTLSKGKLVGGVHLRDIATLDCPNGSCLTGRPPAQFSWYTLAGNFFALRDSNLDPDFPTSAVFAEQMFKQEGGPAVNGVIAITPAVIQAILKVTGPIKVDAFHQTITATNLQDIIHYYHITNYGNDPAVAGKYGTSGHKAFDAELGSLLLQKVGTLAPAQQNQVFSLIFHALGTRDVQMYFNSTEIQTALAGLHLDGAVQAPDADSLFVVDTNVGATYANQDVKENIADAVTLNADDSATHNLTITYNYPVVKHPYDAFWQTHFYYADFVRVIVPKGATLLSQQEGCTPAHTSEAQRAVWACRFSLHRPNSVTLHFRWKVPHVAVTAGGNTQYQYLIQKQAGTHSTVDVKVALPAQSQIIAPLQPPLKAAKGSVEFQGTLDKDQLLVLTYQ